MQMAEDSNTFTILLDGAAIATELEISRWSVRDFFRKISSGGENRDF